MCLCIEDRPDAVLGRPNRMHDVTNGSAAWHAFDMRHPSVSQPNNGNLQFSCDSFAAAAHRPTTWFAASIVDVVMCGLWIQLCVSRQAKKNDITSVGSQQLNETVANRLNVFYVYILFIQPVLSRYIHIREINTECLIKKKYVWFLYCSHCCRVMFIDFF